MSWSLPSEYAVDMPLETPARGPMTRSMVWLTIITGLLILPLLVQMAPRGLATDYEFHIELAQRMASSGKLETPHFLYQALLIAVKRILPMLSFIAAGRLVAWLCYLATHLIVFFWLGEAWQRRQLRTQLHRPVLGAASGIGALVPLTFALCLAMPISIFTWRNFYLGYLAASPHHSPTFVLLKPLALLTFIGIVHTAAGPMPRRQTAWWLVAISAALVLSILAKPNFALILLPGAAICGVVESLRRRDSRLAAIAICIAVPAVLTLGWQYDFEFARRGNAAAESGIAFAPFQVIFSHTQKYWVLPKFFLSIAFPLSLLLARPGVLRRSRELQLAWACFACGCLLAYGFAETGPRMAHGNFLWSGHIGVFLLFVASARELVAEPFDWLHGRSVIPWFFLLLHALFGFIYVSGFSAGYAPGKWL